MLRRVLKYGLVGSIAVTSAASVTYGDEFALTRVARTALTVADIARTYQTVLYSKELDKDTSEYYKARSEAHQIGANKLLELCKINKGVYIKVGQHIGALDYLLPSEYVMTMRVLHKDAPQNTVEELFKVIREDLKQDPNEIFHEFEREPLGTASLAQVHKAKLKDGTVVAVKVQHYFLLGSIQIDLKIMEFAVNVMSKIFPDFQMQWLIDETKKNIYKEIDFIQEGQNAEKVAEMFKDYSWLKVPKIHWDYSTKRVLVMDYCTGGQVNDLKYIQEHKINTYDLCHKIGELFSNMIFVKGFLHSDPHPGNILVKKDPGDKEVTVYLLDHGLYADLSEKFRFHYSKLWLAIIAKNKDAMQCHAEALGIRKGLYGMFVCMVTGRPWDTIMKGIASTKPSSVEKSTFQQELPKIMHYITECLERVDRQALLVLKTNDLIRSIEYALLVREHMVGFKAMTKCCMESVYQVEYKNQASQLRRFLLQFNYAWSIMLLYLYGVYLGLINSRLFNSKQKRTIDNRLFVH